MVIYILIEILRLHRLFHTDHTAIILTVIGLGIKPPAVYGTVLKTDVVLEKGKAKQFFVSVHLMYFHCNANI